MIQKILAPVLAVAAAAVVGVGVVRDQHVWVSALSDALGFTRALAYPSGHPAYVDFIPKGGTP